MKMTKTKQRFKVEDMDRGQIFHIYAESHVQHEPSTTKLIGCSEMGREKINIRLQRGIFLKLCLPLAFVSPRIIAAE